MVGYSNAVDTLTPEHVHLLPTAIFQFRLEERWGMDECKLGEELNVNNDK